MSAELPGHAAKVRSALLSVISNSCLILMKVVTGLATGSISILSEALHSGLDLAASLMAFFSVRAADQPADRVHPFGHGKLESLSGAAEGVLIILASAFIIYAAAGRMLSGHHPLRFPLIGMVIMAISVLVNTAISARLMRIAKKSGSIALEADAWHLRADVYTSGCVLLGMGVIAVSGRFGWHAALHIDPLLAIAVALLILRAGWNITRQSYDHLVDRALSAQEQQALVSLLQGHYGQFVDFHSLRTRQAGNQRHIDFHLLFPPSMSLEKAHNLCDHLEADIRTLLPRSEVLIHIEPAPGREKGEQPPSP